MGPAPAEEGRPRVRGIRSLRRTPRQPLSRFCLAAGHLDQTGREAAGFGPAARRIAIVAPGEARVEHRGPARLHDRRGALQERRCVRRSVDLAANTAELTPVEAHEALDFDESGSRLAHTFGPRHQLFIIGAGMVSTYLAEMAKMLDYRVTVCDPREQFIDDFAVSGVTLVNDMPDDAVKAQTRQREINGGKHTYYCGAYWRYGFHEDGVVSALDALKHFEEDLK